MNITNLDEIYKVAQYSFDVGVCELELDKIDTTPTDLTKISKECDVESLERVTAYLKTKGMKRFISTTKSSN